MDALSAITLAQFVWIVLSISFLIVGLVYRQFSIITAIVWIEAGLDSMLIINAVIGFIWLGVGMMFLGIWLVHVWKGGKQ